MFSKGGGGGKKANTGKTADAKHLGRTGRTKRGNPALRLPARVVRNNAFLLSGHDPIRGPVRKRSYFACAHTSAIDSSGSEVCCMGSINMDHGPIIGGLDAPKIKMLDSTTPCMSLPPYILQYYGFCTARL